MFVLSAALERTGVIASAARALQTVPLRTEWLVLCVVLPPVLAVSAFANNTPVVAVFLPIMTALARDRQMSASRLLMPLSFASILGGSCTLIGTSTNLVASAVGERAGLAPISMFEMAPVGLLLAAAGLAFLLVFSTRLLPSRATVTSLLSGAAGRQFLTGVRASRLVHDRESRTRSIVERAPARPTGGGHPPRQTAHRQFQHSPA
jgi:di/tricarboxylate transporter